MRAVMKNAGILAVSLLIGSTAFGQRGVSTRIEGKSGKPGAVEVPSRPVVNKLGETYKSMQSNPVAKSVENAVTTEAVSKAELMKIETNEIIGKSEAARTIAEVAGNSAAAELINSYRGLAEAAPNKFGGAKLAQLAQDGMSWTNCPACQQGLVNTFHEATSIANRGNHSIKTAFEDALSAKNKLKEFEQNCPAYR